MGQVLTINVDKSKYQFQVLKLNQVNRSIVESQILLQGNTVTLCKDEKGWIQKDGTNPIIQDLVKAIGNSISLRYRV
jgi:hypothetical protein